MNWNKLNTSWKDFAAKNNAELKYNEQNLFHAIKCKYELNVTTDFWNTKFVGVLWKSQQGFNRNHTKISTEFKTDVSEKKLEIKNFGIRNRFFRKRLNPTEENIYQFLNKINGKRLLLNGSSLEIELNGILSKQSEFEHVFELINEVKSL